MSKTYTIDVKRKHIQAGHRGDPWTCAIALATKEQFKAVRVGVVAGDIFIEGVPGRISDLVLHISNKATRFIDQFDSGKKMKPIKLRLTSEL